jgi:hypothetical protein
MTLAGMKRAEKEVMSSRIRIRIRQTAFTTFQTNYLVLRIVKHKYTIYACSHTLTTLACKVKRKTDDNNLGLRFEMRSLENGHVGFQGLSPTGDGTPHRQHDPTCSHITV